MTGGEIVQLFAMLSGLIGTAISAYIALKMAQLKAEGERQAVQVRRVKRKLEQTDKSKDAQFVALTTQVEKVEASVGEVKGAVEEVHKTTNGMKDQLVSEVRAASFAAGQKEESEKNQESTHGTRP